MYDSVPCILQGHSMDFHVNIAIKFAMPISDCYITFEIKCVLDNRPIIDYQECTWKWSSVIPPSTSAPLSIPAPT